MKIVVITGSPRKKGNSFAMTDAFIKEAETCGPHRTTFRCRIFKDRRMSRLPDLL